jgi:ketosteroid isomerase-like protein
MIDEVAIQQTINRYSVAASKRDWDAIIATFAPDGIWELASSGRKFQGRAAIREAMLGTSSASEYNVQMNAPAAITVNGDRAMATSIIRESGKPVGSDQPFEFFGFYEDELVRTADGWKFARLTFVLKARHRFEPAAPSQ